LRVVPTFTHQLHKFSSLEEAEMLKSPAIDTLQPSHVVCQPFQEYTKGEIYGYVYQNKILSICRGFQHFCLLVNATFGFRKGGCEKDMLLSTKGFIPTVFLDA